MNYLIITNYTNTKNNLVELHPKSDSKEIVKINEFHKIYPIQIVYTILFKNFSSEQSARSPGAVVISYCQPPNMSAWNWILVLCKNSKCSSFLISFQPYYLLNSRQCELELEQNIRVSILGSTVLKRTFLKRILSYSYNSPSFRNLKVKLTRELFPNMRILSLTVAVFQRS